ncbi:MAG: hypothetical protein E7317_02155 [Clostridiales bacterium]|nr:hypothetical protein [Clostridiales bacterium]
MPTEAYELLALTARYFFVAVMLVIVLRAAYGAIEDSRRAARLRRLVPLTGLSGELVVLEPAGRIHAGMRYPVIREGMIGGSARADVRIRDRSVRRRHAYFRLDDKGFHIRNHAGSRLLDAAGRPVREVTLSDGGSVVLGDVKLMLVLHFADAFDADTQDARPNPFPRHRDPREIFEGDLFGVDEDGTGDDAYDDPYGRE